MLQELYSENTRYVRRPSPPGHGFNPSVKIIWISTQVKAQMDG